MYLQGTLSIREEEVGPRTHFTDVTCGGGMVLESVAEICLFSRGPNFHFTLLKDVLIIILEHRHLKKTVYQIY